MQTYFPLSFSARKASAFRRLTCDNVATAVLCCVTQGNIFFRICSFSWRRKISLIKFDFREYLFNGLGHLGNLVLRECELKMFIFSSYSILEEFVLTGLLVFRISSKSAKSREIHKNAQNTAKFT